MIYPAGNQPGFQPDFSHHDIQGDMKIYSTALSIIVSLIASSCSAGADFSVSLYDGLQQFHLSAPPASGQKSMTLSASRSETVGLQAIIFNDSDSEMSGIEIVVENIPGVTVHVDAAGAVKVDGNRNMISEDRYFDLLRPAGWETVAPKSFQPYWIDFSVAKDATPGLRDGKITFKHGGKTKSVSVQINISRFVLPVTPTLPLAFAFSRSWVEEFYGRTLTEEELFCCYDAMLEHRLGPVPMWGSSDYFYQEKTIRYCADRGMNVFLVSVAGMSDSNIDASLRDVESKMNLLHELNLLDRTYQFSFDEILMQSDAERKLPWMRASYERFHEKYPAVKRLATSWPDKRLDEFVDIYVVPVGHYQAEMSEKKAVWWYSVGSIQIDSSPDFRIDFPPIVHRYFFLADWRACIDGHLYWAAHREWPFNQELRTKERVEEEWEPSYSHAINKRRIDDCGAGNLFYPGGEKNIVLPSVRVKHLRDGVNDYEYLAQLRAASELLAERRPDGWEKLLREANDLMNFSPNLIDPPQPEYLSWGAQRVKTASLLGINTDILGNWKSSDHSDGRMNRASLTFHPSAVREGGEVALRLLPEKDETFVYQDIPIRPGKDHSASAYIKTDDLKGKAWLRIEYLNDKKMTLKSADSKQYVSGSTGGKTFRKIEVHLPEAPKEAAFLRIFLVSRLESDEPNDKEPLAKAFYDDVTAMADDQPIQVANPGFEEKVHYFDPARTYDFFVFRDRLVGCLERVCIALNDTGPFANAHPGRTRP